jgi:Alpha/beta hydrolase family
MPLFAISGIRMELSGLRNNRNIKKITLGKMKNKIGLYGMLFCLIISQACSYLPSENEVSIDIMYEETPTYIKLSPLTNSVDQGLAFLPGGFVDAHAYVSLMENVVQEGITVVIMKFSANLALLELSKPLQVIERISDIDDWVISGHSLGGIAAQSIISNNPDEFNGLIFLGVYPTESYDLSGWDKNVLSIYAENDLLSTVEEIEANKLYLPPELSIVDPDEMDTLQVDVPVTIYYLIQGGNHAQFGDYGSQEGDGVSTISTEEQHQQISSAIIKFMSHNENF